MRLTLREAADWAVLVCLGSLAVLAFFCLVSLNILREQLAAQTDTLDRLRYAVEQRTPAGDTPEAPLVLLPACDAAATP